MATINVTPGSTVDYTATATGSLPITFSLSGAPSWLAIDQTGRLTGTVPESQAAGTLNFDIVAGNCFSNGQPGNSVRKPMVIVVGSNCQPVVIYDSNTASCVKLQLVSTTYTNTIAKGQAKTDFTIRAEGDESPGKPIVLWTNSANATLRRVEGTARDYKLEVLSAALPDGTYSITVFGMNCTPAVGTPIATTERTYTLIVGTGVGGPPSTGGGGGGSCAATISAPGSHPVDQTLNYQMALTTGGACGVWQTWFLYAGETGGATGTGSVPGQIDSVGISPGSFTKDVSNLPPGNYVIWAKCNDASSCQDTYVTKPIQLTAAGTEPGTGNPGAPCAAPKLVPIVPATFSMRPGQQMSFEIWLTDDSPVDGVSVTARDASGTSGAYLQTTVAWISSRRYNLTIFFPTRDMPPSSTLIIEARNPCGVATYPMNVTRNDGPRPTVPNCSPVVLQTPPTTQMSDPDYGTAVGTINFTGGPLNTLYGYSPTHPNVWVNPIGPNQIRVEGTFAFSDHNVVITVEGCDGLRYSTVWKIEAI